MTGRGGQSALRFARLRMEKRHNYVRKVAETAVSLFITNDKVCSFICLLLMTRFVVFIVFCMSDLKYRF